MNKDSKVQNLNPHHIVNTILIFDIMSKVIVGAIVEAAPINEMVS